MIKLLGFIAICLVIFAAYNYPAEAKVIATEFGRFVSNLFTKGADVINKEILTKELDSPKDRISEDQIRVYDDRVVIERSNIRWSKFADSNSMDPLLDQGHNGLEIIPENPEDIMVGDIIAYELNGETIIHRVIMVGRDEEGIYYFAKGQNNQLRDPYRIRFEQIKGVLVGILY